MYLFWPRGTIKKIPSHSGCREPRKALLGYGDFQVEGIVWVMFSGGLWY
jgi:hypothetical protein